MKRILLLSIAALILAAPASAQYRKSHARSAYHNGRYVSHDYNPRSYYGLRLGFGVSRINSDAEYFDSNDSQTGLNVGFAYGTQLGWAVPLYFETGLYYTEKGGKSTYTENHKDNKFTYGLNYLEVPLLIKYKIPVARDITVDPFLGGYLACGVSGKVKDFGEREAYSSYSDKYNANFNRFDGGLKFGCGVGLQMFYLEASYDLGLANIGNDDFDDVRNGCFNLTFGVNF